MFHHISDHSKRRFCSVALEAIISSVRPERMQISASSWSLYTVLLDLYTRRSQRKSSGHPGMATDTTAHTGRCGPPSMVSRLNQVFIYMQGARGFILTRSTTKCMVEERNALKKYKISIIHCLKKKKGGRGFKVYSFGNYCFLYS